MLEEARSFALKAHGDQPYGDRPYSFHLEMVVGNLAPYGEQAQVIGYLHDVVEDTKARREQIESQFGPFVAECVALVTDGPGKSREEIKSKTNEKLSCVTGPTQLALVVKAADRLANVKACVLDQNRLKWEVYRKEQSAFRQAAHREGLCDPLWAELEKLLDESAFNGEA